MPTVNAATAAPERSSVRAPERLAQRVLTALLLAPAAIVLILLAPTWLFALVIGLIVLAALWEWARLAGWRSRPLRVLMLLLAAAACAALWLLPATSLPLLTIAAIGWLLAPLWLRRPTLWASPTRTHAGIKLALAPLALLPAWQALVHLHRGDMRAHIWTLLVLMLIWAADIGAYFAGTRFGRHRLAPLVSPGKTWEGVAGGVLLALLMALAFGWGLGLRNAPLLVLLAITLPTVAFSIIGDLIESLLKRQAAVKDSGRMFPGHGGLLDRIDSVLAAAPLFVLLKTMLHL